MVAGMGTMAVWVLVLVWEHTLPWDDVGMQGCVQSTLVLVLVLD